MLALRLRKGATKLYSMLVKPVYWLYEKKLYREIKDGPKPIHIGIIPDGNRRWAQSHGLELFLGHEFGYEKMQEVLEWIWELGIKYVTIYAMSTENCIKRSPEEKKHLFDLIGRGLVELKKDARTHKRKIRVSIIGNPELVPEDVRMKGQELVEATKNYSERVLNIAICYGGRHEIVEAIKKISHDYKEGRLKLDDIDEDTVSKYMFTEGQPDLDLIIRTSGEERISNFLLWQSAYSELYFTDIYWPEFRRIDLWRAIRSFQRRRRNFGS